MLNLTFTFQQGKRIEKIGKLEESREMREYQSCLLKTNPKWGPTQVQRDLSPIWGVKLCLISVWWGMINVEATLQACARWSDILFYQDLKKKIVLYSMQNPGELVIFTVVSRKKKSPTMCCKVLCCNAFRDFCKFYLPSLLQIVQIGEIFCNSPRTGTSYNLSQCLELRYYSGEVDLGELYHLYQDIIYFVSIRKK